MKSSAKRFETIQKHFDQVARGFDRGFSKVLPCYEPMIRALMLAMPFPEGRRLRAVDLGCGTGNITQAFLARYPHANVVCVDLAPTMLEVARAKLGKTRAVSFALCDVRDYKFEKKFDVVFSSMALHHVEEHEKKAFYRKLFRALAPGGAFCNADIFHAPEPALQAMYYGQWAAEMARNISPERIKGVFAKHHEEDRPTTMVAELDLLRAAGFKDVDVAWKHFGFAVCCGRKPRAGK